MIRRLTTQLLPVMFLTFYITASVSFANLPDSIAEPMPAASCRPEVLIQLSPSPWSICLDQLNPGKDSCAEVTIDGSRLFGARLNFSRSDSGIWRYTGMSGPDSSATLPDIRIELINDQDGKLSRACFYPDTHGDSLKLPPNVRIENDRPAEPDTIPEVNLNILRTAYDCHPKTYKVVVEKRIYTYPPGFRRDPVLNYAEISMFHCGMSVRMPTSLSLINRASAFCDNHCTILGKLVFEEPKEIVRKEASINRLRRDRPTPPVKEKKPTFLSLRVLHRGD